MKMLQWVIRSQVSREIEKKVQRLGITSKGYFYPMTTVPTSAAGKFYYFLRYSPTLCESIRSMG